MPSNKEKLIELGSAFIGQQKIMPLSVGRIEEKERIIKQRNVNLDLYEVFFWGNIYKEKAVNEVNELNENAPKDFKFLLADKAYDIHGALNEELTSIYFRVAKTFIK